MKNAKNKLTIELKNEKDLDYLTGAYAIICKYREAKQAPRISFSNWLILMSMQGAEAIYKFEQTNQEMIKEKSKDEGDT